MRKVRTSHVPVRKALFAGALFAAVILAGTALRSPVFAGAVTTNPVAACSPVRGRDPVITLQLGPHRTAKRFA